MAIDPTTTTNGSIVAYVASDGGGVWKTTNCCSRRYNVDRRHRRSADLDDQHRRASTIDPNNHNTIYAGTGDLNFGSFSMGSQGMLKSTDAGAHLDGAGRRGFWRRLPGARRAVPAVPGGRQGARRPAERQQRRRRHEEGALLLLRRRRQLGGPCLTNTTRPSARTSPVSTCPSERRHDAHRRRRRHARLRHDRAVQPRSERRERHLQGDDADQRVPDDSRRSPRTPTVRVRHCRLRHSVHDGRKLARNERRTVRRRRLPETSSAASTSRVAPSESRRHLCAGPVDRVNPNPTTARSAAVRCERVPARRLSRRSTAARPGR